MKNTKEIKKRLEFLRKEIQLESISYDELIELQSLIKYIDADDIELLEAAGVPENTNQVYDDCEKLYNKSGATAVHDHVDVQRNINNPLYMNILYKHCTSCETLQPTLNGVCLVCGSSISKIIEPEIGKKINTVGELRELIKDLDNHDQVCVETCDEEGDVVDLFPMYIDVIENIKLTDNTIVREVRFCQMPNSKPDTRDKQPIVDELIEQIKLDTFNGDETVVDELLKLIPYELLINALPEDKGKRLREEL